MIGACRDLTDYRRASEWIEATEKYCDRQSLSGFPGVCRIHRAEVAAVGGAWERAEQELERATTELDRLQRHRRRRPTGSTRSATSAGSGATSRAPRRPSARPTPGVDRRSRRSRSSGWPRARSRRPPRRSTPPSPKRRWDRWARARLLPAQVEIAIAAGDVERRADGGRRAGRDRRGVPVAGARGGPAGRPGSGAPRRGRRAGGGSRAPRRRSRAGARSVRRTRSPGRGRSCRGRFAAVEDEDDADLELRAALDEFRRLGARIDVEAAERELRDAEDRRSGPATARKTFMFTDIVGSTNLAEALGDQAWERLLRWHDDTLRSLVARGGGEIVNSTGDGFFAAFESARSGVDCAISIQRALRRPPREHRLRALRPDRPAHRRGQPARDRLQRQGRPRRRPGRRARRGRGDPGDRRDARRGGRRADVGRALDPGQGRDRTGEPGRDRLDLAVGPVASGHRVVRTGGETVTAARRGQVIVGSVHRGSIPDPTESQ